MKNFICFQALERLNVNSMIPNMLLLLPKPFVIIHIIFGAYVISKFGAYFGVDLFPSGLTRMRVGYKPIPYFSSSGVGFLVDFLLVFTRRPRATPFMPRLNAADSISLMGDFFQGSGK